jgi:hypothetical protein
MDLVSEKGYCSDTEKSALSVLTGMLLKSPIPEDQILSNLGLFLTSKNLARLLFFNYIYQHIVNIQGQIFDLGTRWGNNMAILNSLRSIYEPFNRHRKIVGFDTFCGFPGVSPEDGNSDLMVKGNLYTADGYVDYLRSIMQHHEQLNPMSHVCKFEVIKGDACNTVKQYLDNNKHCIISFAYFDFDIYKPTKECLTIIRDKLVKGSVVAFDELNDQDSPGETIALDEVFGLNSITLCRVPFVSRISYFILE